MDLARQIASPGLSLVKAINFTFHLINLGLVFHLVWLGLSSETGLLPYRSDWISTRNFLYAIYGSLLLLVGAIVATHGQSPASSSSQSPTGLLLPATVVNLILTTFSYAFASLVLDLANLII